MGLVRIISPDSPESVAPSEFVTMRLSLTASVSVSLVVVVPCTVKLPVTTTFPSIVPPVLSYLLLRKAVSAAARADASLSIACCRYPDSVFTVPSTYCLFGTSNAPKGVTGICAPSSKRVRDGTKNVPTTSISASICAASLSKFSFLTDETTQPLPVKV